MSPLLPALALMGCYLLVLRGLAMVRDRGPVGRFDAAGATTAAEAPHASAITRAIDHLSDRLAPRATRLLGPRSLERIRARLDAAGKPMTIEGYAGRKAAYTLMMGGVGLLFLPDGNLVMFVLLTTLGWIWTDIWLSGTARRRQGQIDRDLPDFLDILAVTVAAGVGFRPALARVSEALGGPLAEETMTALHQMDLGSTRRDAFEALRRRNESEALAGFVTALLQAEELGVPLAEALTDLAGDMRRSFHQKARRRAARAAPRVSLITTTVIVPGAVILIIAALFIGSNFNLGGLGG